MFKIIVHSILKCFIWQNSHTSVCCLLPYHSMKCLSDLISCTVDGHVSYVCCGIILVHTCSIHEAFICSPVKPIQFTCVKYKICFIILGRYGHIGKWIQENIMFMRFCCFKLSKKTEKLSNKQPTEKLSSSRHTPS